MNAMIAKLTPLQTPLAKPSRNDWLARFPESGQTFEEWCGSGPHTITGRRTVLCIQPLGDFSKSEDSIVALAAEFLGNYFGLQVRTLRPQPLDNVPPRAQRMNSHTHERQIRTGYLLDDVLKPALPDDAAVLLGFTARDLWPGAGWNFVFGQASLENSVGVWSIHRFGNPDAGDPAFQTALLRTLKLASHETGHMFGMLHCTAWECNMCGSNHLEETDRHPLRLCPPCLAKLCLATGISPEAHLRGLAEFCRRHALNAEADALAEQLLALGGEAAP